MRLLLAQPLDGHLCEGVENLAQVLGEVDGGGRRQRESRGNMDVR